MCEKNQVQCACVLPQPFHLNNNIKKRYNENVPFSSKEMTAWVVCVSCVQPRHAGLQLLVSLQRTNTAVWYGIVAFNPLRTHYNCRATDHYTAIRWLVHWPLMGGLLHLVQRGGDWVGCGPTQSPPCCTVPTEYYLIW